MSSIPWNWIEKDLLRYPEIWTAAGTPPAVFRLIPIDLIQRRRIIPLSATLGGNKELEIANPVLGPAVVVKYSHTSQIFTFCSVISRLIFCPYPINRVTISDKTETVSITRFRESATSQGPGADLSPSKAP